MEKYGLVLAGGGTKGSYQAGALIALKELGVDIGAVSGASIGSLNGALFVQGDTKLLKELYSNIEMHDILKLSDKNTLKNNDKLLSKGNVKSIIKEYIDNHEEAKQIDEEFNGKKCYNKCNNVAYNQCVEIVDN